MKRKATILSIVFIVGLLTAITPNHAKAATMPGVLWVGDGIVIVAVADFGMLDSAEWELVAIADWPDMPSIGLGMRCYYPGNRAFGMTFKHLVSGHWQVFGYYGTWSGEGSVVYGIQHYGGTWEKILHTSPPAAQ